MGDVEAGRLPSSKAGAITLTKSREESYWKTLVSLFEESFFGVLFTLEKNVNEKLYRFDTFAMMMTLLLDFFHFTGFLLHGGFQWGPALKFAGVIANWIQLSVKIPRYEDLLIAFWIVIVVTLVILANAILVGWSFWNKNFTYLWAVKLLHFQVAVTLHIFFLASFAILIVPILCDPRTNTLIEYPDVQCFGWPNIAAFAAGVVSLLILMFLVFSSTLTKVNLMPVQNDLDACVNPIVHIFEYLTLIWMTVLKHLITPIIGGHDGHFWESVGNLAALTLLVVTIVYYLPYQGENHHDENRVIDLVAIAGFVPFFYLGDFLVYGRYKVFDAIATALVHETSMLQDTDDGDDYAAQIVAMKQRRASLVINENRRSVVKDCDEYTRNPYLHLPRILRNYKANISTIEIVGRQLWYATNDGDHLNAAARHYQLAEMAYPDSPYVHLLRSTFILHLTDDPSPLAKKLEEIKKMRPGFVVRFALFKRFMEMKQRNAAMKARGDDSLDLVSYVEFQKYYQEAQRYSNRATTAIRDFWALFLQQSITFDAFNRAARAIVSHKQRAYEVYQTLLAKYPKAPHIVQSYGNFLEVCMNDPEEAERYYRQADELRAREAEGENFNDGNTTASQLDRQAVITISETGVIEDLNKGVPRLFGWAKSELVGRNIKMIIPSPWKEKHMTFLSRYRMTGEAKVINQSRRLFGCHKQGYSFPMNLHVRESRNDEGVRNFVGMISKEEMDGKKLGYVLASQDGTIMMVTDVVTRLFGYNANEMVGKNVTMLMPDTYAAAHENFLRRYIDTGEKRVIGTEGRNLPAKKKGGIEFPISLKVEEEFVDDERYFLATIQDVADLQGTVYIDGYGIIQNCDAAFSLLLGYAKENLIGQNIKIIMPSPYCDYHDLYLDRYRKTGVSNVLSSAEGRLLPALHADGSRVDVKLFVTRADGMGSSFGNKMLFKGTLTRIFDKGGVQISAGGKDGRGIKLPKGFRDNTTIHLTPSGNIAKIDNPILTFLGYDITGAAQLQGLPVDILIPPMEARPAQDASKTWLRNALQTPGQSFYVVMLRRNRTLCPAAVSAIKDRDGTIIIYVCNLMQTDALISINSFGIVSSMNIDAGLLLGHDTDSIIGRNIKVLLPPDVAEHHDEYLQRYNETGESHVVGIPRKTEAIHRDGTMMPVEIQVIEKIVANEKSFIGRIRHLDLQEQVDPAIIDEILRQSRPTEIKVSEHPKKKRESAESERIDETEESAVNTAAPAPLMMMQRPPPTQTQGNSHFDIRSTYSGPSPTASLALLVKEMGTKEEAKSIVSIQEPLSEDGGREKETSENQIAALKVTTVEGQDERVMQTRSADELSVADSRAESQRTSTNGGGSFENKMATIKSSTREDSSSRNLGISLNITFLTCFVFLISCIVTVTLLPTPVTFEPFFGAALEKAIYIDGFIASARQIELVQFPHTNRGPCTWTSAGTLETNVTSKKPLCPFAAEDIDSWRAKIGRTLKKSVQDFGDSIFDFIDDYRGVKSAGDDLDRFVNQQLDVFSYVDVDPDVGVKTTHTLFEILYLVLEVSSAFDTPDTRGK
ncbi:hypothetical protein HK102_003405 [Quaeritorhiza haematococci]|nr:hypothetical protein HK102_003405 [Quaeritorhiza haematococci]